MLWECLYLLAPLIILLTGCKSGSKYEHFDSSMEPKVMHILSEAIEVAGGIEPYQNLAKLKFLKTTSHFDSTGTLASLS
jgi:hypothetical protein